MMRIAIGCDHVGYPQKASVVAALEQDAHAVLDLGAHGTDPVDYPALARAVATAIGNGFVEIGVLLCASGIGGSIAANKFKGIRAAAPHDADTARRGRQHEDVNLICVDATKTNADAALAIVREWLGAQFSGDNHDRRTIAKIAEIEETSRQAGHQPQGGELRSVKATASGPARRAAAPPATAPRSGAAVLESPRIQAEPKPLAAVETYIATMKDDEVRTMAGRILEFIRGRFPAVAGTPGHDGFSFTVNGEHAATITVGKRFVQLEAGPDHIPTSRIRELEELEVALALPSIVRALDAIKS